MEPAFMEETHALVPSILGVSSGRSASCHVRGMESGRKEEPADTSMSPLDDGMALAHAMWTR
jgi:hypothetical protein